ncbi:MAG: serine/threonine-protein kinase [Gemmatimonadales bacterium]
MTRADELWDRWDEVDRLLDEALELEPDRRVAVVLERTPDDEALRALVLRLLERMASGDDRLSKVPSRLVEQAFDKGTPTDLAAGTEVGRWVITGFRGRGGMATVYEAERSDGVYQQRVAIKVLRRGLDTDDLVGRFLTERQILSSLTHPSIARLLDGGSLPDGRPYLVMELVEGVPITAYADERRLPVPERLRLFLEVADAVQAAHRQLVVHRDIKPTNVLVDGEGRAKLLDFGIAKLLEGDETVTEVGDRALTPDYASPEQLRGDPITTGTDVYQLGLMLRELLVGLPPRDDGTERGDPPTKPSRGARKTMPNVPEPAERAERRRTTPDRLASRLAGDLDLIVGTALRQAPEDRYQSVDELAADVRRHLDGLPIAAHPESFVYRARKFAGRHPLVIPSAVAALVATVAFVSVIVLQNRRLERERDAAARASARAVATQSFLVELLRSSDPVRSGDRDVTVVEALQRGRERVANELGDQPELRAALLEAMGATFSGLGRQETADTLLRSAYELARELYGVTSDEVAGVLVALADNFRQQRLFVEAAPLYERAYEIRTRGGTQVDSSVATLLYAMGTTRRELRQPDSALTLSSRAVELRRQAGDTSSRAYVSALSALAFALRGVQRLDSAEAVYLEVLRRIEGSQQTNVVGHALAYNNLAFTRRSLGNQQGAEEAYRRAYDLLREPLGEGHPTVLLISNNLAGTLELRGKIDEALALGQLRIEGVEHEWPNGHWRVGSAYHSIGRLLSRHDR